MSKLFYDNMLDLSQVEKEIKKHVKDAEAREEVYHLIDEIVHHRVLGCILDKLPAANHKEFLSRFSEKPHDQTLVKYLSERIATDVEVFIREEMVMLGTELLQLVKY
jgi:hypothetical protein